MGDNGRPDPPQDGHTIQQRGAFSGVLHAETVATKKSLFYYSAKRLVPIFAGRRSIWALRRAKIMEGGRFLCINLGRCSFEKETWPPPQIKPCRLKL